MEIWQWFAENVTLPVLFTLAGWLAWLTKRISSVEKEQMTFVLKASETYATKRDLHSFGEQVLERFDRLENKIDRLIERGQGR